MIQDATFMHSDPGHAKIDKLRENEAKIRENRNEIWTKKIKDKSESSKIKCNIIVVVLRTSAIIAFT